MLGLTSREGRFALIISSAHFSQHVYYRVLPPLIPILAVALEYPLWQLGLLLSLYSVGMGIAHAPLGIVADRVDRIVLLPPGIILTGAAYVLFAIAPWISAPVPAVPVAGHTFDGGFVVMAISMGVVGVGLAVVHPAGYPMITDNVAAEHKGTVLGLFGAASKLGDGAAPAVIAGLVLAFSWQEIIVGFGVAGVAYGILLFAALRRGGYETVPSGQRSGGKEDPNDEPTSRRAYVYPMLVLYAFFLTSMIAASGLTAFLPTYLIAVYEFSVAIGEFQLAPESVANLYFAVLLLSGAVMQVVLGGMTDRTDPRHLLVGCMVLATGGMFVLSVVDLNALVLVAVIVLLGAGMFGVNPARDMLISDLSPAAREGRTFGYVFTVVTLVGAPLPTVIGYLLDTVGMREGYLLLTVGPIVAAGCIALLYLDVVYDAEDSAATIPGPSD